MYLRSGLMVIDPGTSNPIVEFLEMDESQLSVGWVDHVFHSIQLFMLECNGKLLLVVGAFGFSESFGFQVFEADLCNRSWVGEPR